MFEVSGVKVGGGEGLFVIGGPCVIESKGLCVEVAERMKAICEAVGVGYMFKASFDKANRSSIDSYRGPGLDEGLAVLADVKDRTGLAVVTDVHEACQAEAAAEVVDVLQVPAFLCRQTDLLVACAKTGRAVNVKKGQFVSAEEMGNAVGKLRAGGAERVMLTERGTFFGYNRLVNDMTAIAEMQRHSVPVVFDATHSTQQPGGLGNQSGGRREMAGLLARSAVAAGADGLFLEVHPEPGKAKCDAASMMVLDDVEGVLAKCKAIYEIVRG